MVLQAYVEETHTQVVPLLVLVLVLVLRLLLPLVLLFPLWRSAALHQLRLIQLDSMALHVYPIPFSILPVLFLLLLLLFLLLLLIIPLLLLILGMILNFFLIPLCPLLAQTHVLRATCQLMWTWWWHSFRWLFTLKHFSSAWGVEALPSSSTIIHYTHLFYSNICSKRPVSRRKYQ